MKTKFVVKAIGEMYGGVELTLVKYTPPPKPEPEPEPEPVIDPLESFKPETDEERVMLKLLKAMRKYAPHLFPIFSPDRPLTRAVRMVLPVQETKLPLTVEEYNNLEKPGLGQMLELELEKVEEKQK